MTTPQIRPYAESDEDAVLALWDACDLTRPWNPPRLDIQRKLVVDPELFLVALIDEILVGTAMFGYDGHRGWVNYVGVLPQAQRRGVATALMQHGERALADRGCPKINLQIRDSNASARGFYASLGYADDAVVSMGKRLTQD